MQKARAHTPDELVRLGLLNQHGQSDQVCHCRCKALLCCKVAAYSSGVVDHGKEDCLRSVRTDCARKQRVSCDWWARRVGCRAATSARAAAELPCPARSQPPSAAREPRPERSRAPQSKLWAGRGEVTTSGSKFEVVEIEKHAARGTIRCVSPRSFDCTYGTPVWVTTALGTPDSVTSPR